VTSHFPDSLLPRVRETVSAALTCEADSVQTCLEMLFAQRMGSLRAMLAASLCDKDSALDVGIALDLIHVALQRLHLRLEDENGIPALLGKGASVLGGDYLTSGAFMIMIRCRDMEVLAMVAQVITRTCEVDTGALQAHPRRSVARQRAALDLALAGVAAQASAKLGGHDEATQALARRLGQRLMAAHALDSLLEHEPEAMGPTNRLTRALQGALRTARALEAATGSVRPLALMAFVEAALRPKTEAISA
jgi:octaprenyl-diphosphate synthase